MNKDRTSRCPFETKGREDGTIINVWLGEDKAERLREMVAAFVRFHCEKEATAIRFTLPSSILKACTDNASLEPLLLPYQAEVIAANLDWRLRPLVFYMVTGGWQALFVEQYREKDKKRTLQAAGLVPIFRATKAERPTTIVEQAEWIETFFRGLRSGEIDAKSAYVEWSHDDGRKIPVIRLDAGAITMLLDELRIDDPATNWNRFTIVKTPFYPDTFWRFSENVEIVVLRQADFWAIDERRRKEILFDANLVHRDHGVNVPNLSENKPPAGLWVHTRDMKKNE